MLESGWIENILANVLQIWNNEQAVLLNQLLNVAVPRGRIRSTVTKDSVWVKDTF